MKQLSSTDVLALLHPPPPITDIHLHKMSFSLHQVLMTTYK